MCLTPEAMQERKWGQFPVLRQVIQDERIPDHYYGLTPMSENIFNRIKDTTEIAILVKEYKQNITAQAQYMDREKIRNDLSKLEDILKNMYRFFDESIDEIGRLKRTL